MNFFMNLTVYTQNVYEPYATSHFKAHSLLATGSIVAGIVRIVSYPLLAKLANVGTPRHTTLASTNGIHSISAALWALPVAHWLWP